MQQELNNERVKNPLETRLRAIARDLDAKQKAKWERIETAVRRIEALADDVGKGVEG
jgi:hypothetical protein